MKGNIFRKPHDQVMAVGLKCYRVIPPEHVFTTMKGARVEEWDFPFPYSHEIPFPVGNNSLNNLVDKAFDRLFARAGLFLT